MSIIQKGGAAKEKGPQTPQNGVEISREVFDGLEFIRQSGVTNMLDRPMVLNLAREQGYDDTADWIESVDTRTYGELIFKGPIVIDDEPTTEIEEQELTPMNIENSPSLDNHNHLEFEEDSPAEKLNQAMDDERARVRDAIVGLSKIATLTIADTYATEEMGVELAADRQDLINSERIRLNRSLGEISKLWDELNDTITEVQRGVGSLQYLIDPENN